jgi:hypothetical protein
MAKVRIGNYVDFDAEKQSMDLLPLLECLRFAVDWGRPVDAFLKGILPPGEGGYCGGDPGWEISSSDDDLKNWYDEKGNRLFYAWTHQPVSGLDPCDGYYPVDVVRHHAREVLDNFRARHPDRAAEVDAAIKRLQLEDA